jgi:uncharacterized repeat protein (TIGR01451 family)
MLKTVSRMFVILSLFIGLLASPLAAQAAGNTYYVSSSGGSDSNSGLSPEAAFQTIAKVNSLALGAGDKVLFRCGDTWRAEMLRIIRSGTSGSPITYGSYPSETCSDKPVISGALPLTGWTLYSGNIYRVDLAAGENAGHFPHGINQLFRDGKRLGIGRFPNITAPDGGYSTIDSQPGGNKITDDALPAVDWSGAGVHIKGMRWYILNRTVTGDSGNTLTLNSAASCWGGCAGWGFWLDNHLATLDQDGEWFYDAAAQRVYLYSTHGAPANIEASVVFDESSAFLGGIILGEHLKAHVTDLVIDNFRISKWFDNGITTPTNLEKDENARIIIRNNTIQDVNGTGIRLSTWVWNAAANGNGYNGWRGGKDLQIINNVIDGANRMGIDSYARQTLIEGNLIQNTAMIANLGTSGMGCDLDSGEGGCTEDGDGIRIKTDNDGAYSGNYVTVRANRIIYTGYNGMDVFGYHNMFEKNFIQYACYSKGDCGAVRTYGSGSLSNTNVHDLTFDSNIFVDTIGNTDGAISSYDALFGFGLYFDNASRAVTAVNNTIANSTAAGILYQNSTGSAQYNTLYNNSSALPWSAQTVLTGGITQLNAYDHNQMLTQQASAATLDADDKAQLAASDWNGFYHTTRGAHISVQGSRSLAQWQAYSGKDGHSSERVDAALSKARIFYNDTFTSKSYDLTAGYTFLDGSPTGPAMTLAPFTSRILVANDLPALSIKVLGPLMVGAGGHITYTLRVENLGAGTATNVLVRDPLPENTLYQSGGTLTDGVVSWTIGSMPGFSGQDLNLEVQVNGQVTTIRNSGATASADGGYQASAAAWVTFIDPHMVYWPLIQKP